MLKYLFCFFPNLALTFGFDVIFQFERSSKTLDYEQIYTNIFDDPLNLGSIMAAMIGWSIIYIAIHWYLEKILPGEFGVPLQFYFPLMVNINKQLLIYFVT